MSFSTRLAALLLASWVSFGASLSATAADQAFVGVLALASEPAVAKELGLSEDVLKQLNDLIGKREDEVGALVLNLPKDLEQADKDAKMAEFAAESEKQGLKLLTAEQQAKLQQIRVRRVGPVALMEAAIADQLELTAKQRGQLKTTHGFYELETATAPEATKAKAKVEFEKKLLALLTPEQKAKWDTLEGRTGAEVAQAAPVDPEKPLTEKPAIGKPAVGTSPRVGLTAPGSNATLKPAREPLKAGDPNVKLKFQFSYAPWKDVIQWFAEQADYSLVSDVYPQGTFNYSDSTRSYTPAQGLDLLNKVLITKGYRLIRHERMLFLLSSEDELPDTFAPRIAEADLDKQGEFEIVQCQFQLSKITAEEAEAEVKKLLGLQGKVIILSKARQLVVTDTVGSLKQVRNAIKAIENPETPKEDNLTIIKLEFIRPSEFMTIARDVEGIPAALNALPDGSLRISPDELGMRLFVTGKPEKIERITKLKSLIDVETGEVGLEGAVLDQPQIEVYSVQNADPASVMAVLQSVLANIPEVRLALDPKSGNIIAHCRAAQHATIRALLEQMQKDATKFTVFKLTKNDPQALALQINELYGADKGVINAPKVVADPTNLELSVRASPAQLAQIEELLRGKGELGGSGLAANPAQRDTVRIISNGTGRSALEAVQQIEQMWKAGSRANNLIIHARKKNVPAQLQNNLVPGAGSPTSAAPNGARLKPLGESNEPVLDPSSRNFADEFGIDPRELRNGPPKAPAGPAPPPAALPHVEPKAPAAPPAKQTEPTARHNPTNSPHYISRQLPAGETSEKKADAAVAPAPAAAPGSEAPAPEASAEAPKGPVSKPGADVVISLGPAGIILQSEDLDALDELEGRLRMIIDASNAKGKEFHIMYLHHAKAQVVATLLQELLSGASSGGEPSGGGGGGGLMGDLASSMMGDMFGGLLGGMGGGGGGGSAVSAGSAQITADIRLNALYIRANSRDLELIEDFIEVIDQPENPEGTQMSPKPRFIPVKYTTADSIAAVVRQVYSGRLTAEAGGGAQRQPSPQEFIQALRGGGRGGQQQQNKGEEIKMTVGVDTRTNSLIVAAPDYLFNEVKALVEQLDVSELASDQIVRVYSLKSSNADVITRSVASVYGEKISVTKTGTTGTTSTRPGGMGQGAQRPGGQQQQQQRPGGNQGQGAPQQPQMNMQDLLNAAQRGGGGGGRGGGGGGPGGGGFGGGGQGGGGFGGGGRGGR
jgi:type II secretory pathway component GspD/PulD (secretin)